MALGTYALAQEGEACEADLLFSVQAPSGLKLRLGPSTSSQHLVTVPLDSVVLACTKTFGALQVSDTRGFWRFVHYKQHEGFMYDGFLRPVNLSTADSLKDAKRASSSSATVQPPAPISFTLAMETYNYCGDHDQLDPSLHWYGIYPPEQGKTAFTLERIRLELVLLSTGANGLMEFDVRTDREQKSLFLIGTNQPLDRGDLLYLPSVWQNELPVTMYPGMETTVFARSVAEDPKNLKMQAFGAVLPGTEDKCPSLVDHQIHIRTIGPMDQRTQDIAPLLQTTDACAPPELIWFGDLNGDGWADALWAVKNREVARLSLLISVHQGNDIWTLADSWIIKNCQP